jgi:hypothetical protein
VDEFGLPSRPAGLNRIESRRQAQGVRHGSALLALDPRRIYDRNRAADILDGFRCRVALTVTSGSSTVSGSGSASWEPSGQGRRQNRRR